LKRSNRYNYYDAIESGHLLDKIPEFDKFKQDAGYLINKCKGFKRASSDCNTLGYNESCDKSKDSTCDYTPQLNDYNSSKDNLKSKLDDCKSFGQGPRLPS